MRALGLYVTGASLSSNLQVKQRRSRFTYFITPYIAGLRLLEVVRSCFWAVNPVDTGRTSTGRRPLTLRLQSTVTQAVTLVLARAYVTYGMLNFVFSKVFSRL